MLFETIFDKNDIKELNDAIEKVINFSEEELTPTLIDATIAMAKGMGQVDEQTINSIQQSFRAQNFSNSAEAKSAIDDIRKNMLAEVAALNLENKDKERIVVSFVEAMLTPFYTAAEMVDGTDVTIKWVKAEPNAVIPTYAHNTDACADLYAIENVKVAKHSCGNMIRTGLKADIPDGWFLEIRSRSGMAARTPLRIANGVGTIDSGYKGEIIVLFDNISGKDYEIQSGDRIAQIRPVPVYTFRSEEVNNVGTSERGEGGFGSSGK